MYLYVYFMCTYIFTYNSQNIDKTIFLNKNGVKCTYAATYATLEGFLLRFCSHCLLLTENSLLVQL